ncbi:hypothetical protein GRI62_03420 [Erythrobacter arachoides]|uniref:DUF4402 domain-containing protein n=1 Tax=Aurantiacibacter arachoides TaxID=1850444 RepID=A0A845A0J4_9SPHN|nr:hypothetical protein [Aurantiacibacter arachoides]MXO92656.1 hypothetical protein [Aurantiacibacter arachoides]GGD55435.1 hypothetical protein GCM10011411_14310 [Aurantiacibacter arachoides]
MKIVFKAALATTALVAFAGSAQAQTHTSTRIQYANPVVGPTGNVDTPLNFGEAITVAINEGLLALDIGTRYLATSTAANNTEAATPTVANTFTLTGTVSRDCSFYAGNTNAARTIDFGTIGVRTGNNENVNAAFEMAGPATATVQTLTAGCNTNNSVEVSKNDIRGMVNANPGGYDTDEFQANIPYAVTASWTGVGLNAVTTGTQQGFTVPTTGNAGSLQQGAWRSAMEIAFNAPAITDRGLVAGTYSGTTTVTLRAL